MKAKLTKNESYNAKNLGNSKELVEEKTVVVICKGDIHTPITARWYMGRSNQASVVYCSIWIHGGPNPHHCSGHGSAGGYGYHKISAAFEDALDSAGVELYGSPYDKANRSKKRCHIGGTGDTAVNMALEAITRALGYRGKMVIV